MSPYNRFCKGPANWIGIKPSQRSMFAGPKVPTKLSQVRDDVLYALSVVRNIYPTFRTERADHMSEDNVACLVPGARAVNPMSEELNMVWAPRKAWMYNHVGPKIGTERTNNQYMFPPRLRTWDFGQLPRQEPGVHEPGCTTAR